jgi:hypothetical protein
MMGKRKGLLLFTQHVRRKDESSAAEAARQGENSQITDDSGLAWSTQQAMRVVPQDARSNRVWKAFSFFGADAKTLASFWSSALRDPWNTSGTQARRVTFRPILSRFVAGLYSEQNVR